MGIPIYAWITSGAVLGLGLVWAIYKKFTMADKNAIENATKDNWIQGQLDKEGAEKEAKERMQDELSKEDRDLLDW